MLASWTSTNPSNNGKDATGFSEFIYPDVTSLSEIILSCLARLQVRALAPKHVEKRSKESDKMKKNEDGKQAEAEDDEVMPPRKATPVVVRTSSDRLLHLAGVRLPAV